MPRMELMGVLIGVRATKFVKTQMRLECPTFLWCDSQIVLNWIKSTKVTDTFVENRLKEIRKFKDINFRYINTKENPADLATRADGFGTRSQLWWHGPGWLNSPQAAWPEWIPQAHVSSKSQNKRENYNLELLCPVDSVTQPNNAMPPFLINILKFSNYTKLLRVTSRCKIFIEKLRDSTRSSSVLAKDMQASARLRLKYAQEQEYMAVLQCIDQNRKHSIINQLGVQLDENGLLRCYGRMEHMEADDYTKFPVLLPSKHPLTSLIIKEMHERMHHAGVSHVLANLRKMFWIPKGRSRCQALQSQCKLRQRVQGPPYKQPPMPHLQKERVTTSNPYSYTGLDYFGPLFVKTPHGSKKVWVCLLTCLTVRSIHLEMVQDLSAEEFMLALRRFMATYGSPRKIVCDNAPAFKVVALATDDLWSELVRSKMVQDYTANINIKWTYITPYAPWMGGVYERMVKSVKEVLKKILGKSKLAPTQLETILKEAQQVVNERPLTYVGKDSGDVKVLRPIDLIMPTCARDGPLGRCIDDDIDVDYNPEVTTRGQLVALWKKGNNLLQEFWKTWSDHYLLSLRQKQSWTHKGPRCTTSANPQVGDVVLIREDMHTRSTWKMARIISLSHGDHVRTATVKLPDGHELTRPVSLLYPIETSTQSMNHDDTGHQTTTTEAPQHNIQQRSRESSSTSTTRPKRNAFVQAQDKIRQQANLD